LVATFCGCFWPSGVIVTWPCLRTMTLRPSPLGLSRTLRSPGLYEHVNGGFWVRRNRFWKYLSRLTFALSILATSVLASAAAQPSPVL
jgi:hypothetical protein